MSAFWSSIGTALAGAGAVTLEALAGQWGTAFGTALSVVGALDSINNTALQNQTNAQANIDNYNRIITDNNTQISLNENAKVALSQQLTEQNRIVNEKGYKTQGNLAAVQGASRLGFAGTFQNLHNANQYEINQSVNALKETYDQKASSLNTKIKGLNTDSSNIKNKYIPDQQNSIAQNQTFGQTVTHAWNKVKSWWNSLWS